jgi:hypothetical protein
MTRTFALAAAAALVASTASATVFTRTSPTGGLLPAGATEIGGAVLDLEGLNGVRVVAQAAASTLFVGFADTGTPAAFQGNPFTVGIQTGFTPAIIAALGGGLSSASVRITLFDGDSAPGDFDDGDLTFFVNGVSFGNNSSVTTEETDPTGVTSFGFFTGFPDGRLVTGFYTNTNAGDLATLFASLAGGTVTYTILDTDPFDNFYDFTAGVDGGLIDIGSGPTITPAPAAVALFGLGLAVVALRRRRA